MGIERATDPRAASPTHEPHACVPPEKEKFGPGTVWRCDECDIRYVLQPTKTWRYGLGAWLEAIVLVPGLLFIPLFYFHDRLFGWRRTRYMTVLSIVVVAILLISGFNAVL